MIPKGGTTIVMHIDWMDGFQQINIHISELDMNDWFVEGSSVLVSMPSAEEKELVLHKDEKIEI